MKEENGLTGFEIAVIGVAGRFPGAGNIDEFRVNLENGVEAISFFADDELKERGIEPGQLEEPGLVKAQGILADLEYFDPGFFGYTPKEAELMDPQVRIFHQCAWEALEDAGCNPESYDGLIGLYAGASANFLWEGQCLLSGKTADLGVFASIQLIDKDFLCSRVSFKLNLKGPAVNVQTACSTSLVAVHLAYQAILNGECDMALAGGVTAFSLDEKGYTYQEGMIMSPDGHCRAFDAEAQGTVPGEGAGVVVLKRLAEAVAEGNHIYAVIKGSAINNDGFRKVGFTAPSIEGQREVIRMAQMMAEVEPESIGYIETHGTGTALGDPVELKALTEAFNTDKKGYCLIGSVKTNIGHTDAASGIAGFIKTVLALKHKQIPPSLHFKTPNPRIDLENSPFRVNTGLVEWKNSQYPLRAGVSSFGIGGTNAHVILEEAPPISKDRDTPPGGKPGLILLSAVTGAALNRATGNLREYLTSRRRIHLADVAYTLQVGRKAFKHRRMFVCENVEEAIEVLDSPGAAKVDTFFLTEVKPYVVFLFAGLGSQYVDMGLELYREEPVFRSQMDRCFEILSPLLEEDIKSIIYPGENREEAEKKIHETGISQLVVFSYEYALARLLMTWGIKPRAMMGYSFGEYSAACLAGVFSLEDALTLVVARGKLLKAIPAGAMLSVPVPREQLKPLLEKDKTLAIAVDNGPSCIVSGPLSSIENFEKPMKQKRLLCMKLQASHALHSPMMEPLLKRFESEVGKVSLNPPGIPYIANVTGTWQKAEDAVSPGYWAKHLRNTVQFSRGMNQLIKEPGAIFVEIGPGRDLSALAARYLDSSPAQEQHVINIASPPGKKISAPRYLLNKIGLLWLYGVDIDWSALNSQKKRYLIPLPTYPFERQQYRVDSAPSANTAEALAKKLKIGKKTGISNWFYIPSWEPSLLPARDKNRHYLLKSSTWLVFMDECGIGSQVVERLRHGGYNIITVAVGAEYKKSSEFAYVIRPQACSDYEMLFTDLHTQNKFPDRILHLWGIDEEENPGIKKALDLGFYSLLYLTRGMAKLTTKGAVEISVVANRVVEVTGEEILCPGKAAVLSPVLVIPQEHPSLFCRFMDIVLPGPGRFPRRKLLDQVETELLSGALERMVAFRGNHRLIQAFKPVCLEQDQEDELPLRDGGVYLITGGLGKIALTIAGSLAEGFRAKLILTGRSPFPGRDEWEHWLATHDEQDSISEKIRKLKQYEALGAAVMVFSADVAHPEQMKEVIAAAEKQFGRINGVIHAAGLAGDDDDTFQVMQKLGKLECERQFQAKIYGLVCLENLFREKELDFCWLMSSISTVLGGLQFAAYAAANAFMDAFVHQHNRLNQDTWMSVDWDGMEADDTITGFKRTLSLGRRGIDQVVVSAGGNLQERIDQWVKLETFRHEDSSKREAVSSLYPRPNLSNPYLAPRTPVEREITDILQKLFGFEQIGVQDDFLELGGDSLKAITVISRVNRVFNVEIPLPVFFKMPTVEQMVGYINNAEKRARTSVEPVEKKDFYPLSAAQKRLYILQQMEKNSTAYNDIEAKILEGNLDGHKLEKALRKLIDRHECLRTSIEIKEGEPVQKIHEAREVEFAIRFDEVGEEEARELLTNFVKPFDLRHAPFLRAGVIKVGQARQILILDMHHIVTDGVSFEIFIRDFIALYHDWELSPLRLQYTDFSVWQTGGQARESLKPQEAYWLKQFTGQVPSLDLPTDYPRPAILSFAGNLLHFEISADETAVLRAYALERGTTIFTVLLALYTLFLFKITGQEDLLVGTPIAGRRHNELEEIMGIFVNTLVMRNYPAGGKTFAVFLREVWQRVMETFQNQEYQFEDLVEKISANRDVSRNPLFDTMFVLQNIKPRIDDRSIAKISQLRIGPYELEHHTAKFDLTLICLEVEEKLACSFEYCTKLFKKSTIERFILYFRNLISLGVKNDSQKISQLEIITAREKQHLLYDFNQTASKYPQDKTLQQWFAEQVERTPDHLALTGMISPYPNPVPHGSPSAKVPFGRLNARGNHHSITYRKLNERSNQLAQRLQEKAVGPGIPVAIMTEPGLEMIIGILAILKAGGAYLPVNAGYPPARKEYVFKDANVRLLLTMEYLLEKNKDLLCYFSFEKILLIEDETLYQGRDSNPRLLNRPRDLAYILYTSGSTGRPKGVMVEHGNVVNVLTWFGREYHLGPGTHILLLTDYTFDPSVEDLLGTLVHGGVVFPGASDLIMDRQRFCQYIRVHRIYMINFIPTQLKELLCHHQELASLRFVISGGEKLEESLKDRLRGGSFILYNNYGPSETTIDALVWRCSPGKVLLGKPINNVKCYILDKYLGIVPVGISGELYIAGAGVSRGYLNNPELTGEKFDHDLWDYRDYHDKTLLQGGQGGSFFPGERGRLQVQVGNWRAIKKEANYNRSGLPAPPPGRRRFYKTGDLARWWEDGNVEFIGRIDQQVKIRGFRIELGEIEHQLLQHPGITDTVVTVRENPPGDKDLCAYFVPQQPGDSATALSHDEIREFLSLLLPGYMIPPYSVRVERIPLTPTGKIDRQALNSIPLNPVEEYAAPRDEIEKLLTAIWAEVLMKPGTAIGINDNFFKLGGHSLKVTVLASKMREQFNLDIPLLVLFKTPTIKSLADFIRPQAVPAGIAPGKSSQVLLLKSGEAPGGRSGNLKHFFFIHDGTGEVEAYLELCRHLTAVEGFNFWGIKAKKTENIAPMNVSLEKLAREYLREIKSLQAHGPYYIAGWSIGGTIAFEMARQLEQEGEKPGFLALVDTSPPNTHLFKNQTGNPTVHEFSLESELDEIRRYFPDLPIKDELADSGDLEGVWSLLLQCLEETGLDVGAVLDTVLPGETPAESVLFDVDQRSIKEIIYYFNMMRTLERARDTYIPGNKIRTRLHFFKAEGTGLTAVDAWSIYCAEPIKIYEVKGDHYSIFKTPLVEDFAHLFAAVLK